MKTIFAAALGFVSLAACSGPAAFEAALEAGPPQTAREIGGSVDAVRYDAAAGTLTVEGWGLVTGKTKAPQIRIYADGAKSILSAERLSRPDVVQAVGDKDLTQAGFRVTLAVEAGKSPTQVCVTTEDGHYGPRLLNPHAADQIRCTAAGQ